MQCVTLASQTDALLHCLAVLLIGKRHGIQCISVLYDSELLGSARRM